MQIHSTKVISSILIPTSKITVDTDNESVYKERVTMKRKHKTPKERNPFVAHIMLKRAGAHGKTNKALRRAEKIKLMDR